MSRRWFRRAGRAGLGGGAGLTLSSITPSLGDTAAGTWLTLTGLGFSGSPSVTIGGTSCTSVTVVSPTQIDCVAPAKAAGTYDVVLTIGATTKTLASAYEAWSPAEISGARVYDAESGVTQVANAISQWDDRGAGAKNLTQGTAGAKPTYAANRFGYANHAHALSFDGGDSLAAAAKEAFSSGKSVFFVGKFTSNDSAATQYNPALTVVGDTAGSSYGNGPGFHGGKLSTVNYIEAAGPFTRYNFGSTDRNDGTPRMYGIIHLSGGTLRGYVNGSQEGTDQSSAINTSFYGWDNIGFGFTSTDNFVGELAATIVLNGNLSDSDRGKLYSWAHARFLRGATAFNVQTASAAYSTARDGAHLVSLGSKMFLIGGWNPGAFPGAVDTTNEVWESSDDGATWSQTLAYDASPPTSGAGARFRRRHAVGCCTHTYNSTTYIYVIGGDHIDTDGGNYWQDVWRSSDGSTWERVTANGGWGARVLHMVWSFGGKLYVAGGQSDIATPGTATNDIWESSDGGATWTQTTASAPWAARGAVYSPVEFAGKIWICGGGKYHNTPASRTYYNDVWSWDGASWTQVVADGAAPWSKRQYISLATMGGRLWIVNGYETPGANVSDCWSSTDGSTWYQQTMTPWLATHAAALAATPTGDALVYCCGIETAANVYKVSVL